MFNMLRKMLKYPRLTVDYPRKPFDAPFITGKPVINSSLCTHCGECVKCCPSEALVVTGADGNVGLNLDQCIYCRLCEEVCPVQAILMSREFESAEKDRQSLRQSPLVIENRNIPTQDYEVIGRKIAVETERVFGRRRRHGLLRRSLQIREVDAGSCNGCDYEINALNNPFNDLERFGIHFVASPRHADMLLVTGTVSRNMELALIKTYNATPDPKLVVAVGACALSGGIFKDSHVTRNGIDSVIPVDVYVPGCPPRPQAILYGILKALDRIK